MKSKIEITDTVHSALAKMSEGNPGAATVCIKILADGEAIDPDAAMGGLGAILEMDDLGIRGSKIWMLYKDVCGQDLPTTIGVLRGHQLGYVSDDELRYAVENRGYGISVSGICSKVAERLPRFRFNKSTQLSA